MLFIPLSISTSFFVIFPFLFDNKLGMPEHSPIALFVNGLLTISLQSYFSRKINLTIKQTLWVAPILAVGIVLPWFITLKYISVVSAYIYLVIFTVIEVYALTAMANLLVKFDNGTNRGFIFGSSRLLLSIATVIVMNLVPHLFEFALNSDRPFVLRFYFTSNSTLSNNFFTALLSRNLSAFSTIGRVKCGEKNSIKSYI